MSREEKTGKNWHALEIMRASTLIFLLTCYTKFFLYVIQGWESKLISRKLVIEEILLLLFLTITVKKIIVGAGSWIIFQQYFNRFFLSCIDAWNSSLRSNFSTLEKPLCFVIGAALLICAGTFFLIPSNPLALVNFMPEHINMYSMVDSSPQRIAYEVFLLIIMGSALYFVLLQKKIAAHDIASNHWAIMVGALVLVLAALSLWTSNLDMRAGTILIIAMAIAFAAQYANFHWVAWISIGALIICAMLPGWLHTPEPDVSWLKSVDQHYDSYIYRGRQLALGHLFSADSPPLYSTLWAILIGIVAQENQPPTFAELIRFVQAGQVVFLVAFMLAALLRTRGQTTNTRAEVMTFFAVAVVPWLSTDGNSTWLPTQSGLRFLFIPIAICSAFFIERISAIRAGAVVGLIVGLALIANFETGVVITAGLSVAWLVRVRDESPWIWVYSAISGVTVAFGCCLILELTYRYFFGSPIFPNGMKTLFERLSNSGGFAGLKLPFRSITIVIIAHASYKFIQSIRGVFNHNIAPPDIVTSAIATMLLVWFPYYVNRPDDWNLWLFTTCYILLLIPMFEAGRKNILPFIVVSFIVLPLSIRWFPTAIIDPLLAQWHSEAQPVCAGGLRLPKEFCEHLQMRAKTLQEIASHGSVGWSTSLPVLTDQTANVRGPFWTGNLLGFTLTTTHYNELVKKIAESKFDFILFDDPKDRYILPLPQEVSFNRKLYLSLQQDYCEPKLQGGWLIAQRNLNGKCGRLKIKKSKRIKY